MEKSTDKDTIMKICACGTTDEALASAIRSLELPLKAGDCAIWLTAVVSLQIMILMHLMGSDADKIIEEISRLGLSSMVVKSQAVKDLVELEKELRNAQKTF